MFGSKNICNEINKSIKEKKFQKVLPVPASLIFHFEPLELLERGEENLKVVMHLVHVFAREEGVPVKRVLKVQKDENKYSGYFA